MKYMLRFYASKNRMKMMKRTYQNNSQTSIMVSKIFKLVFPNYIILTTNPVNFQTSCFLIYITLLCLSLRLWELLTYLWMICALRVIDNVIFNDTCSESDWQCYFWMICTLRMLLSISLEELMFFQAEIW